MRAFWWTLKLLAGLSLVGCLLSVAFATLFPDRAARHAGAWLGVFLASAGVYRIADARLGGPARRPAAARWQGDRYEIPAPLLRQAGLCVVLASVGLGMPLAFVRAGRHPGWQAGLALLGGLLCLWLCRAAILGFLNMRRAGYALKLDTSGVHYPGLPRLPWTEVAGLALDPPRPDADRSQCLVLQMRKLPARPSKLQALWRAPLPGASIARDAISLPLPTLRKPAEVLGAAQSLWRRAHP
jgi:hypothetical protein